MGFEVTLVPAQAKSFLRALNTMNRVGKDVLFMTSDTELKLITEGDANASILVFTFDAPFFNSLICDSPGKMTCNLKLLCRTCNRSKYRPVGLRINIHEQRIEFIWKNDGLNRGVCRHVFAAIEDKIEIPQPPTTDYFCMLEGKLIVRILGCFNQDEITIGTSKKSQGLYLKQKMEDGNIGAALNIDKTEFHESRFPDEDSVEMSMSTREMRALSSFATYFASVQNDFQTGLIKLNFTNNAGDPVRIDCSFDKKFRAMLVQSTRCSPESAQANMRAAASAAAEQNRDEAPANGGAKKGRGNKRLKREASAAQANPELLVFAPPWGPNAPSSQTQVNAQGNSQGNSQVNGGTQAHTQGDPDRARRGASRMSIIGSFVDTPGKGGENEDMRNDDVLNGGANVNDEIRHNDGNGNAGGGVGRETTIHNDDINDKNVLDLETQDLLNPTPEYNALHRDPESQQHQQQEQEPQEQHQQQEQQHQQHQQQQPCARPPATPQVDNLISRLHEGRRPNVQLNEHQEHHQQPLRRQEYASASAFVDDSPPFGETRRPQHMSNHHQRPAHEREIAHLREGIRPEEHHHHHHHHHQAHQATPSSSPRIHPVEQEVIRPPPPGAAEAMGGQYVSEAPHAGVEQEQPRIQAAEATTDRPAQEQTKDINLALEVEPWLMADSDDDESEENVVPLSRPAVNANNWLSINDLW